ncbi:MAG: hypothetical protein GY841_21630 [FCB group bacterium]|nr:hypothetical protein [FCB group bacterium]
MRGNRSIILGATLIAAAMLFFIGGCSEKIINDSPPGDSTIKLAVKWAGITETSIERQFRVVVTAEDIAEPIIGIMVVVDGFLIGEVIVPSGLNRSVAVEAMDKDGVVLYRGEQTIDVGFASVTVLDINLFPMQPMVYITPHYQDVIMGNQFAIDIVVHNIPGLSSMTVNFGIGPSPTNFLSVSKGADLDDSADVWWETDGYSSAAIGVWTRDQTAGIVDELGNGRVARITFGSLSDWGTNIAEADMLMTIDALWSFTTGDSIPIAGKFTDGASVILRRGLGDNTSGGSVGD